MGIGGQPNDRSEVWLVLFGRPSMRCSYDIIMWARSQKLQCLYKGTYQISGYLRTTVVLYLSVASSRQTTPYIQALQLPILPQTQRTMTPFQRLTSLLLLTVYLHSTQAMPAPTKQSAASLTTEKKAKQLLGWPLPSAVPYQIDYRLSLNLVGKGEACGVGIDIDSMVFCEYPYTCSRLDDGSCQLPRELNVDYEDMSPQELSFIEDLYENYEN